jgi:hypothetical protein
MKINKYTPSPPHGGRREIPEGNEGDERRKYLQKKLLSFFGNFIVRSNS